MTEIRTTSATGASKGVKPARFSLIPADVLWELAEHYGIGAEKYEPLPDGRDNWRGGYEWSKSVDALERHFNSWKRGEDIDPETGTKNLIAAIWHAFSLVHWSNDPDLAAMYDDRQDNRP